MFSHYPKLGNKTSRKSPQKHSTDETRQSHKRPNINKIKEQIQTILKRNSNPFSLQAEKPLRKLHNNNSNEHLQLLQRQKSKILQKANEQNLKKARNGRKLYQEYLFSDIAGKSYYKTLQTHKQASLLPIMKQTATMMYQGKQKSLEFSTSRTKFSQYQTLNENQKNKKERTKSIFTQKQKQQLGLGKLLFYKDSSVKLRRNDLLSGRTSTQKRNLFKQTANQSFYPQLDISKFLKPHSKSMLEHQSSDDVSTQLQQTQPMLTPKRSLQIFKKQLVVKYPVVNQQPSTSSSTNNPEQLKITGNQKDLDTPSQKFVKKVEKYHISPHWRDLEKLEANNQTLNVIDEELLVYYGKMKNKNTHGVTYAKSGLRGSRTHTKNYSLERQLGSQIVPTEVKNSMEVASFKKRQHSWKFNHLDPWEKHKFDDELQHENMFSRISSQIRTEQKQDSSINLADSFSK